MRVVVIAGPANSGKMPLAKKLLGEDPDLLLVHRDDVRRIIHNSLDEASITRLMLNLARGVLQLGRSPVICAWNLEPSDRKLWTDLAETYRVPLVWLDVRHPVVAAQIPPC